MPTRVSILQKVCTSIPSKHKCRFNAASTSKNQYKKTDIHKEISGNNIIKIAKS